MRKHIFLFFLILFGFSPIATMIQAKADDLVIKADGAVILIITKDNNVLAETTKKDEEKPKEPEKPSAQKPAQHHEEPLTPPHSQTTVQITPPASNDKKVEVTVTQSRPNPALPQSQPTNPATSTIKKTVDQVVAEGTNGKPVLTISSSRANELTISQGTTQVSTNLPLTLDTLTHSLSIGTLSGQNSPARVSVLPSEVLRDVLDKGYINPTDIGKVKINLTKDSRGVTYTVNSQKKGKFLGVVDVIAPVQVKLSAQTGIIINTAQLALFTFLERFIK